MKYLPMALVVVSGMTIPVKIAANTRLSEVLRSPVLAAAVALLARPTLTALLAASGMGASAANLLQRRERRHGRRSAGC